jgi:hypothetical protein
VQRTAPPAKLQTSGAVHVVAPPSRLRQQKVPAEHTEPSRQPMLAPPGHVAPALMHIDPLD